MYLDGDRECPTLVGTGAEDYAGTSWGIRSASANLYQGLSFVDNDKMRFCLYCYHIPVLVYFSRDIRATVQQIGMVEEDDPLYKKGIPIYRAGCGVSCARDEFVWLL